MPLDELSQTLGIEIDPELLTLALTHSSYAYENGSKDNERLEFLGDSVLGFLVATFVFKTHSDLQEGELQRVLFPRVKDGVDALLVALEGSTATN